MGDSILRSNEARGLTPAKLVDELCKRFRAAWKAGKQPRIEDFLSQAPQSHRSVLFCYLLGQELTFRTRAGEQPDLAEYQARFPDNRGLIQGVFRGASKTTADSKVSRFDKAATTPTPLPPAKTNEDTHRDQRDRVPSTPVSVKVPEVVKDGPPVQMPVEAKSRSAKASSAQPPAPSNGTDKSNPMAKGPTSSPVESPQRGEVGPADAKPSLPNPPFASSGALRQGSSSDAFVLEFAPDESATVSANDESMMGGSTVPPSASVSSATVRLPAPDEPAADSVESISRLTGLPVNAPRVPGYEIIRVLGRGGMGVVYKAKQIKLNRYVALKMVLAGAHASQRQLIRFYREARAVAQLQHPNIVQVYEYSDHEGLPYFSLEYVEGGTLSKKLSGVPLPPREAAQIAEILARAIRAAHEQGVVHRDLKPANILLTPDGTPKVADFGLAKRLEEISPQTQSGALIGTPSYMAPEQAQGDTRDVGPPADIWSLGAILYEMLTGRPPFNAATPLETMAQVVLQDVVPPSQLHAKLPRDLETICLTCLQKDPGRRYANVDALAEDLRRYLANETIVARPAGFWERSRAMARRHATLTALAALFAIVSGFAFGVVTWLYLRAEDQRQNVADKLAAAERRANESQGQTDQSRGASAEAQIASAQTEDLRSKTLRLSKTLALDRAQRLMTEGDRSIGLLWLARSLETNGSGDKQLERVVRSNLAFWYPIHPRQHTLEHPGAQLVALSADGRTILTAGADGSAYFWNRATLRHLNSESKYGGGIRAAALDQVGNQVLIGRINGRAEWSRVPPSKSVELKLNPPDDLSAVACSANGSVVALGGMRGVVQIFDPEKGSCRATLPSQKSDPVRCIACNEDGSVIAIGRGREISLWSAKKEGAPLQLSQESLVLACALSPDGNFLAAASADHKVRIWKLRSGERTPIFLGLYGEPRILAFSAGGAKLLTGESHGVLRLWDSDSGQPISPPLGRGGRLLAAILQPDGKAIITVGEDGEAPGGTLVTREWRLPDPIESRVERIKCWAEVESGRELDELGMDHSLSEGALTARKRRLNDLGGPPVKSQPD